MKAYPCLKEVVELLPPETAVRLIREVMTVELLNADWIAAFIRREEIKEALLNGR